MRQVSNRLLPSVPFLIALSVTASLCQQPTDPLAEARSLLAAGKLAESETEVRGYLIASPSSAEAHYLLGYILFREHKPKESLAEFTDGAKYRHPHPDELKIVASDYVLLGDFGDADKWFAEVVAADPNDADAWYLLGRAKFTETNFPMAISSFEHAVALRPKYVEAENNLGLAWQESNNSDKAELAFLNAIEWQGDAPVDAQPFLNLGALLVEQNDLDKAFFYLTKAVEMAPDNPSIHEKLSKAYAARQNLPKAQSELERAVALAPDTSSLHFKLGQIYRKEGLSERANAEFDICTKLSGTHSSDKTPNPLSLGNNEDR